MRAVTDEINLIRGFVGAIVFPSDWERPILETIRPYPVKPSSPEYLRKTGCTLDLATTCFELL
jgi:hypothetical protein